MIKKKDVTTLELDVETSGIDFFMDQNVSISGKIHKNGDLDDEGLKVGSPSSSQKTNRRRAVHREISRSAHKKIINPQGEHE